MSPDREKLLQRIIDVKNWMAANFPKTQQGKSETLIIGPEADRQEAALKLQNSGFNLGSLGKSGSFL